jgi:hypothetical protein
LLHGFIFIIYGIHHPPLTLVDQGVSVHRQIVAFDRNQERAPDGRAREERVLRRFDPERLAAAVGVHSLSHSHHFTLQRLLGTLCLE